MKARIVAGVVLGGLVCVAACAGKTPEPEPPGGTAQQPVEAEDAGPSAINDPTGWVDGGTTAATSSDAGSWAPGVEARMADAGDAIGSSLRDAGHQAAATARDAGTRTTAAARDAGTAVVKKTEETATATAQAVAEPDKKTQRQWKSKCGSCHGEDGKGQTRKGKELGVEDMTARAYQKKSDADLRKAIENGAKSESGGEMEGFKGDLSAEEIQKLVWYVRWLGAR